MNEQQISIAANAVAGLADATDTQIDDILEVLAGNIVSEEDCGRIRKRIAEA